MYDRERKTYLIHDNSGELKWADYKSLGITDIPIVPYSPDMNAFAERFVKTVRRECFDHFIVMTERHLWNLMSRFVKYYNQMRPHQGIGNRIPNGNKPQREGKIKKESVLFGLHNHYYRSAA